MKYSPMVKKRLSFTTGVAALAIPAVLLSVTAVPARAGETYPPPKDSNVQDVAVPTQNPVDPQTPQKKGYVITASEEFNRGKLNTSLFASHYLPHWSKGQTKADLEFTKSTLRLRMTKERKDWDPKFDAGTKVSSIQTYHRDYIHKRANYPDVARKVKPMRGHLQKYGYFELRAKVAPGAGVRSAWWMIGVNQDQPEGVNADSSRNGEVDIFNILGKDKAQSGHFIVNGWADKWRLWYAKKKFTSKNGSFSDKFHVFGFDWQPSGMTLYVDGEKVAWTDNSPDYPMMTLLSVYENQRGGWMGTYDPKVPYPKHFEIDYFRAYQKVGQLPYELKFADGYMRGNTRADGDVTRWIGGRGNDATLRNVWVPKAGKYRISFEYRSAQPRDLHLRVNGGAPRIFKGLINGTFAGTFGKETMEVQLRAGLNNVSVSNPSGWAPDVRKVWVENFSPKGS